MPRRPEYINTDNSVRVATQVGDHDPFLVTHVRWITLSSPECGKMGVASHPYLNTNFVYVLVWSATDQEHNVCA